MIERGEVWREDATNADAAIPRNRLRRDVMPAIDAFSSGAVRALARFADASAADEEVLERLTIETLASLVLSNEETAITLDASALRDVPPAIATRAIRTAIDRLGEILDAASGLAGENRLRFLDAIVDVLLEHRLAVSIFVTQSAALQDVPIVERANAFIERIAAFFQANVDSPEEKMRFGIALGGTAYLLAQAGHIDDFPGDEVVRPLLVRIIGELVASPAPLEN